KQKLAAKGKHVPIIVDHSAFKDENPDRWPDPEALWNAQIKPPEPELQRTRWSAATVLGWGLASIETRNATFVVNPGHIEVTTVDRSPVENRLTQRINVRFRGRTLADAVEELYDLTGVAVVLDTRAGRAAQMPISATFTHDTSLGSALLLMSEMAGLKLVVGDNIVYMTTPAHAQQFLLERWMNPYALPVLQGYGYAREKRVEAAE